MKLSRIISAVDPIEVSGFSEREIEGVTSDSREKLKNSIFIAVKGLTSDGALYSQDAVTCGATAVVYETEIPKMMSGITYIKVKSAREIQSVIASLVYEEPAAKLNIAGVTGTNGKTSFAYIYRHILTQNGIKCGLLGTTEYDLGKRKFTPSRTTPDAVFLQRYLNEMINSKLTDAVMEVSSHAIALERVRGVAFDTAVFTNLTIDHLDFHNTIGEYAEVKSKLFSEHLKQGALSVINADDTYSGLMKEAAQNEIRTFSRKDRDAVLFIENVEYVNDGIEVTYIFEGESFKIRTNLNGGFQAENIAAAVLCALHRKISLKNIIKAFEKEIYISGRMETVYNGEFRVIIDYAHTPDALENTLRTINEFKKKRVITVFGCGGDRDREKRSIMGRTASVMSDSVIVTSDNPRYEDPDKIIEEIVSGMKGAEYKIISDRKKAIGEAIGSAGEDDIVLIAGKGHEDYQEKDGVKYPFSDSETVRKITGSAE
jgi:UDP-N-acetylmuramoyl-L-alanyl-D-glutamate--2,6-diaminopimelate ligase